MLPRQPSDRADVRHAEIRVLRALEEDDADLGVRLERRLHLGRAGGVDEVRLQTVLA
jgi:hypothetical protein